ncbi:MAG: hypothetical protein KAH86_03550 [Methanosarcinales archaeon]|nr:hypothetical protein [Methanosarcinales archaeon]
MVDESENINEILAPFLEVIKSLTIQSGNDIIALNGIVEIVKSTKFAETNRLLELLNGQSDTLGSEINIYESIINNLENLFIVIENSYGNQKEMHDLSSRIFDQLDAKIKDQKSTK